MRHLPPDPASTLPVYLAGNTLNECPQCSGSVVFGSTFTRTRGPNLLTFMCDVQTASASFGSIPWPWPEIVAFLHTP